MLKIVESTLARFRMLPTGSRVLAAVSGGPDSTALLHVLRELGAPLAGVAHVNHQLRGAESDDDENFAVSLSNKMGLSCFIARGGSSATGNLEENLRHFRRDFFRSLLREGKATHVALGHTRDDQAETVLFRILRGSGLPGLAGILPVTADGIIRPLLEVSREQVIAFLRERNLPWREDSSNRSDRFRRNRLRHHLLPQLKKDWNPQLATHLAQLASLAYEEEHEWAVQVQEAAEASLRLETGAAELDLRAFPLSPAAVQRRLLRLGIRKVIGHLRGIEYNHIERMLELAHQPEGEGAMHAPGIEVRRSFDWLRISKIGHDSSVAPTEVRIPGVYALPESRLNLAFRSGDGRIPCDTLKMTVARMELELRGWQPGDRYSPGTGGKVRKLRELFQNARIPSWRRPSWPILTTRDSRIIWTRGFGPAQEFAAAPSSARAIRVWESGLEEEDASA